MMIPKGMQPGRNSPGTKEPKDKAKKSLIADQVFANISHAWKLRCDSSVSEAEYEKVLRMTLQRMQP